MKALYFNCRSGASGDMIAGSLLDLGVNKNYLIKELAKLGLENYRIEIKKINKRGVEAVRFIVHAKKENKTRGINDINKIIEQSSFQPAVKILSKKIFLNLAKAEAKVHKTPIDKVHFHEVGAIDSIIDIVSAAVLIKKLGPEIIYSSLLSLGRETAPATKELLRDIPVSILNIDKELTTPTGAAIIKTIANGFEDNLDIKTEKKGYGAGKINLKIPNVLEAISGKIKMNKEKSTILETNIDDMNPEFYGYVIKRLIDNGAKEAFIQPLIMKKDRIGTLLTAICDEKIKDKLIEIIFDETTTFGIRVNKISRICLDRKFKKIRTKYGPINVKIGEYKGKIRTISPEYEDCKKAALKNNAPIKKIYDEVKKVS